MGQFLHHNTMGFTIGIRNLESSLPALRRLVDSDEWYDYLGKFRRALKGPSVLALATSLSANRGSMTRTIDHERA
jgi:hypothetical protein